MGSQEQPQLSDGPVLDADAVEQRNPQVRVNRARSTRR